MLEVRLSVLHWLRRLPVQQPKCPGLKTETYPQSYTSCEFQNRQILLKCVFSFAVCYFILLLDQHVML